MALADSSALESPLPNEEGPAMDPPDATTPIAKISYDAAGRVKWVQAQIAQNPAPGDTPTADMQAYARAEGNPTDAAGHVVAARLGGNAAAPWQVFPQNPSISSGVFSQWEGCVFANALHEPIDYYLRFTYAPQGQSKRPVRFEAAFVRTVQNPKVWTGEAFRNP